MVKALVDVVIERYEKNTGNLKLSFHGLNYQIGIINFHAFEDPQFPRYANVIVIQTPPDKLPELLADLEKNGIGFSEPIPDLINSVAEILAQEPQTNVSDASFEAEVSEVIPPDALKWEGDKDSKIDIELNQLDKKINGSLQRILINFKIAGNVEVRSSVDYDEPAQSAKLVKIIKLHDKNKRDQIASTIGSIVTEKKLGNIAVSHNKGQDEEYDLLIIARGPEVTTEYLAYKRMAESLAAIEKELPAKGFGGHSTGFSMWN